MAGLSHSTISKTQTLDGWHFAVYSYINIRNNITPLFYINISKYTNANTQTYFDLVKN